MKLDKNTLRLIPSSEAIDQMLGKGERTCPYCGESTDPDALLDSYGADAYADAYERDQAREQVLSSLYDAINKKDLSKIVRLSRKVGGSL